MEITLSGLVSQSVCSSWPGRRNYLSFALSTGVLSLSNKHNFVLLVRDDELLILNETHLRSSVDILDGTGIQGHIQFGNLLTSTIAVCFSNNAPDQTGIVIGNRRTFSNHRAIWKNKFIEQRIMLFRESRNFIAKQAKNGQSRRCP